ncbi:EAL domain-containing protein [Thermosyntropha sp.]|uniref:EAL domain-containing protein n=1 Tax=Thermosyntropha sp. TaxID=2740820 RepID=UPI0025E6CF79|nr:EAL domain-containing protein [Thermosyntropha sp.]MBO8159142.1 EAL domain-containing protein [Thermosyntropha sp.]
MKEFIYTSLIEFFPLPSYILKGEKIVLCNEKAAKLLGYEREEIINELFLKFSPSYQPDEGNSKDKGEKMIRKAYEAGFNRFRWLYRRKDGGEFWAEVAIKCEGDFCLATVINLDGTCDHKDALDFTPVRDYLTGTYDKRFFREKLEYILKAERKNSEVVLFFIDLDRFKEINDALGHQAGDELLKQIARRIEEILPSNAMIARYGGDEFVVLLEEKEDKERLYKLAEKIIDAINQPCRMEGRTFYVSASIGIACYPEDGLNAYTLLKNADIAMYKAKAVYDETYRIKFFSPEMEEEIKERFFIHSCLRQALEKGELFIHFQPIVELKSGQVKTAEVLLRWENEALGNIPPDKFIPLAEESGVIHDIGDFVLKEACRFINQYRNKIRRSLALSINISLKQLERLNFAEEVREILKHYGVEGRELEFEITERVAAGNIKVITENLQKIKELGIKISMDDFGSGYSSFAMLLNLEVDKIKIDKQFIDKIERDRENKITRAVVSVARELGMEIVAEGVEFEEQIRFLKGLGCQYGQGYFWSKPLNEEDFIAYLFERNI